MGFVLFLSASWMAAAAALTVVYLILVLIMILPLLVSRLRVCFFGVDDGGPGLVGVAVAVCESEANASFLSVPVVATSSFLQQFPELL